MFWEDIVSLFFYSAIFSTFGVSENFLSSFDLSILFEMLIFIYFYGESLDINIAVCWSNHDVSKYMQLSPRLNRSCTYRVERKHTGKHLDRIHFPSVNTLCHFREVRVRESFYRRTFCRPEFFVQESSKETSQEVWKSKDNIYCQDGIVIYRQRIYDSPNMK